MSASATGVCFIAGRAIGGNADRGDAAGVDDALHAGRARGSSMLRRSLDIGAVQLRRIARAEPVIRGDVEQRLRSRRSARRARRDRRDRRSTISTGSAAGCGDPIRRAPARAPASPRAAERGPPPRRRTGGARDQRLHVRRLRAPQRAAPARHRAQRAARGPIARCQAQQRHEVEPGARTVRQSSRQIRSCPDCVGGRRDRRAAARRPRCRRSTRTAMNGRPWIGPPARRPGSPCRPRPRRWRDAAPPSRQRRDRCAALVSRRPLRTGERRGQRATRLAPARDRASQQRVPSSATILRSGRHDGARRAARDRVRRPGPSSPAPRRRPAIRARGRRGRRGASPCR